MLPPSDRLRAGDIRIPGVEVRVLGRCTSTNALLMDEAPESAVLLAAEAQSAGRGRRGRRWLSRPGSDVTFSLARPVARAPRELACLSLAAGVAVSRALEALGARGVGLKWPNDLIWRGAKLGGILVETRSGARAPVAVVGVGLNVRRDARLGARLRRPVACLEDALPLLPSRNDIIAAIGDELMRALDAFERHGLAASREHWMARDAHAGRPVRVRLADGRTLSGIGAGIDAHGALQVSTPGGVRAVATGRLLATA